MRPTKTTNHQEDLFRNRLSNQLNPKHELLQLSKMIPWHTMEEEFAKIFDEEQAVGRPATASAVSSWVVITATYAQFV